MAAVLPALDRLADCLLSNCAAAETKTTTRSSKADMHRCRSRLAERRAAPTPGPQHVGKLGAAAKRRVCLRGRAVAEACR